MNSIDLCLHCKKKDCTGTCEAVRQAEREENQNRKLTVDGETHTLTEWAKITGLSYKTIAGRIYKGKTGAEIIKPKREWKRRADNG